MRRFAHRPRINRSGSLSDSSSISTSYRWSWSCGPTAGSSFFPACSLYSSHTIFLRHCIQSLVSFWRYDPARIRSFSVLLGPCQVPLQSNRHPRQPLLYWLSVILAWICSVWVRVLTSKGAHHAGTNVRNGVVSRNVTAVIRLWSVPLAGPDKSQHP